MASKASACPAPGCRKTKRGNMGCNVCTRAFHQACTEVTSEEWSFYTDKLKDKGFQWVCDACSSSTKEEAETRLSTVESSILDIGESIKGIQDMLMTQKKEMETAQATYASVTRVSSDKINTVTENSAQLVVAARKTEKLIKQQIANLGKDERKNNMILTGLPEEEGEETRQVVATILEDTCRVPMSEVVSVFRLGKKVEGRTRPVKVTLTSESSKWDALKRVNHAKPEGCYANLDYSQEERATQYKRRQELRKLREQQPDSRYRIKNDNVQVYGQEGKWENLPQ